jgi:predicted nucleic acid-binding protein
MKPIFLDANVFIYAAGASHPLKSPCADLLRRIAAGSVSAATNAEVVQEILHVYSRRGARKDAVRLALETADLFPGLLPVTREDVCIACRLVEKYRALSSRDAVHVATMLANDITIIASADPDFDHVQEIVRIPPEKV